MKLETLTREELRDLMTASGAINQFDIDSEQWRHAFKMFWKETGNTHYDMSCGKCVQKVYEWLKK